MPATGTPKVEGIAGYVTPYPYLDRLQEKMEERIEHRVPAAGRFPSMAVPPGSGAVHRGARLLVSTPSPPRRLQLPGS